MEIKHAAVIGFAILVYVGALRHCCVFYRHNGEVTLLDYKILILSDKCHWSDKITILYEKQCYVY